MKAGASVWGLTRGWDNSVLGGSVLESSSALFLPCCVAVSQSSSFGTSAVRLRFLKLPAVPMLSNDLHHSPCHSHCFLNAVPASWVHAFQDSGQCPICISVRSGWIRNLPRLTSLYLRKMPRLRSLEGDIFKMTPDLQHLDCQHSPALSSVHTYIFQDTPHLRVLHFQK